ncbi:hypothetical protein B0A55_01688 [Friedmanniomyces simplex]|uniref:Cell wall protein n=1 Tax=Friedmanniomyces simplex TaxID=329884 RepID=A0A4U0Y1M5_9PEZI|nr:hypothetical protein B0A55_01688 [Friedmanniomyces simplex]
MKFTSTLSILAVMGVGITAAPIKVLPGMDDMVPKGTYLPPGVVIRPLSGDRGPLEPLPYGFDAESLPHVDGVEGASGVDAEDEDGNGFVGGGPGPVVINDFDADS